MQAVRDIMATGVVTLDPAMTLREAAGVFADHHVTGAPVVVDRRVIGILSASNILGADARRPDDDDLARLPPWGILDHATAPFFARLWPDAAVEVNERFSIGARSVRPTIHGALDERTVLEAMSHDVLQIRPEATIMHAADRMAAACVHRLLVIDDDGLAGIISTMHIARWSADRLREGLALPSASKVALERLR